jgi:pimeloyl-ACP methyl ester carboxylesterase
MGFTSSRQRQAVFTDYMINETGASALVIDYTGHGESPFELKDTCPAQHVGEVVYAFDWIKAKYPNADIAVVGNSYGSFLATHLAHYRSFGSLVLRAPAIYPPKILYDLWSVRFSDEAAFGREVQQFRTNPQVLKDTPLLQTRTLPFQGRTLVVAHEHDETIPAQTSKAYAQAFAGDSFVAKGFSHAVSQSDITDAQLAEYHQRIADWLNAA